MNMHPKLEEWLVQRPTLAGMVWRGAAQRQWTLLRDIVLPLARELDELSEIRVVSTHRSKGIELPVVEISLPCLGIRIWARDNFHDWAVTVESESELDGLDVRGLNFGDLHGCYFEGFVKRDIPIYGPYQDDRRRFSYHAAIALDEMLGRIATCLS